MRLVNSKSEKDINRMTPKYITTHAYKIFSKRSNGKTYMNPVLFVKNYKYLFLIII